MIVNRLEKLCRICVESLVQRISTGIRLKGWLKQKEREGETRRGQRGEKKRKERERERERESGKLEKGRTLWAILSARSGCGRNLQNQ